MENVSSRDRAILREIANRKLELVHSAENERILAQWKAQAAGRRESPIIRLLFCNMGDEVIAPRMRCEGETARRIEWSLLDSMAGRELFGDDTPLSPTFEVGLSTGAYPFRIYPKQFTRPGYKGYHIEPQSDDLERDFELFTGGSYTIDRKGTDAWCAAADELIGDILPSRVVMYNLCPSFTNPLVRIIGMETYYLSMYDCPDTLHRIMEDACRLFENWFDALEQQGALLPTNGISPISQESFAFTDELPADHAEKTTDVWGFLEAQETAAVSKEMFGEFIFPYYDRMVRRFGLLSYGCCEGVDTLWEDYLSKWKNLRKLSVSPFNDMYRVGEYLRGSRVVFYSKPRAEHLTMEGPLDEDVITKYFGEVAKAASGCMLEVAQREAGTIFHDPQRGRRYVQLAREAIEKNWKP